ncbi:hypothetical protein QVD17_03464 [Tagetes erecta]|uniref:Uncharacterized protein n=1 Tax=Tagetes erecta TaxID=13708 RepID=A0AAD8LB10_TARER|nr:hypothetical protein QVD17_03464 [Tagetes erecta]
MFRIITNTVFILLILVLIISPPIKASIDDTTPGSPNDEIKCGTCPCGTTCYASPPPPVPSPPPPSPPPPPKKQSPTNCPPPPSHGGQAPPNYIYITGPPGDIYPVVQSVNGGLRFFTVPPSVVVAFGLLISC